MNNKKVILLVEDEMLIALNEAMTLEKNGYDVVTAVSGETAVDEICSGVQIDLVLMDINLGSGIDGTTAAEMILEEVDIPLIFMSSHTEREVVNKTQGITSYGYIVKNSGETVMLTSIQMAFKLFDAKKAEVGILKARSIWEKTINSIKDSILLIDNDNRILNYNKAFARFAGRGDEDLRGLKCMDIVHETECNKDQCPFQRMKKSGKLERTRIPLRTGIYEIIVDPLFNSKGEVEGAVHVIAEVSDTEILENSIIAPGLGRESVKFSELFELDKIQKLQDDFSSVNRLTSWIVTPDGTPITRPSNFRRFCSELVRGTVKGLEACEKSDVAFGKPSLSGPAIDRCCSCGLWKAGSAITVAGNHVATWLIGQVLDESASLDGVIQKAADLGVDRDDAAGALEELSAMSEDEFRKVAELLYTIADMLSDGAYRNYQKSRMIERVIESEEKINQLLEQKNLLLKEVHHRVKNNISSLAALLTMQLEFTREPEAVAAIKDAIGRVNSTRVLYEKLLNSGEYDTMPVRQFVEDIYREISQMYPDKSGVRIDINISDLILSSDQMFPLGIIINEILTNAFKYAFPESDEGEIGITIRTEADYSTLEIIDNGIGFKGELSLENPGSYGLKLVKMLTMQLNSDLSIGNRDDGVSGAVCRLKLNNAG